MSRKRITRQKDANEQSAKGTQAAASGATKTIAEREVAVVAKEEKILGREQDVNADAAVVLGREGLVQSREEATDLREESADVREDVATLREQAMRDQEDTTRATAVHNAGIEAQLEEANELLVAATANAQTMTETAEAATAQLAHMAGHDSLTGLPNRSLLRSHLEQSIVLAQHHVKKVALLFLDIDHFKHINDSLGHALGDELLQAAARRLQTCVRYSDTISREGGDEFAVLLSEVLSVQDAVRTAEKLAKTMADPHLIEGHRLHLTLSIGISIYPDDAKDAEAMIGNADIAMHYAKKSGRDNCRTFTPDMNVRALARQSVEEALRHALDQHEFVLLYQPKVNLETGLITGAEALLRWRQSGSLIGPTQFVGIAEDSGLILPIGRWVLREACRQTREWLLAGLDFGRIAINVSAVEFHHRDFLAGVRAIFEDTGVDPRHLEFEVTESVLMQDTEPTTAILLALKALGVHIAIDDFGTGYSSLSYLRRFPIDTLKIDQSFVAELDSDTGEAIVGAIIAMGTSLKQRTIAEGMETRQQLTFLQSRHCTEGQGHFFSRPVAAEQFSALLRNGRPLPMAENSEGALSPQ